MGIADDTLTAIDDFTEAGAAAWAMSARLQDHDPALAALFSALAYKLDGCAAASGEIFTYLSDLDLDGPDL